MTRTKTSTLLVPLLIALTTLSGCEGGKADKAKKAADPDVAICGKLLNDGGPIGRTLDIAEDYVDTGNARTAREADPVAIADTFDSLTDPGSAELARLVTPISIDLHRIYNFTVGEVDSMTDLSELVDEVDALLDHCSAVKDGEPERSASDAERSPADDQGPMNFSSLDEMRTAYEKITGTTCDDPEPVEDGDDVTYLLCDASTDDVSSDVLIYELDGSGPVEDLARLEIDMSSGTTDRVVAHADDWRWAVATASSERLSKVITAFADASDETVKTAS